MRPADLRPIVSVIIPCHGEARFLVDAVRSASARSARVQVVVVDDGSTDETAAVARGLDVMLVRQPNGGLAAARNVGLRASTGEFVIFLDAGDRLLDGAIDDGVHALVSSPGCAMAYGRATVTGADGEPCPSGEMPTVRTGHHAAFLQTNLIWVLAAAIFRRAALTRAGGFAEGLDGAADYDLYLRISRDARVLDHGCCVAAYRRHPGATNGNAARRLRDTLEVMRRNCPGPRTPLHGAWREGYARWQEFYGTQLLEEIYAHVHERAFAEAGRKSLVLLSRAPRVLAREIALKVRSHSDKAMPAADIPAVRPRAET